MVSTAPKITDEAAEFYRKYFPVSFNASLTFVLDAFPSFYTRTLAEMRGVFSRGELGLILDVLNGHGMLLLSSHHAPALIGQHIALEIHDALCLTPGLAETWKIDDIFGLMERINRLTIFQKICIEIWASGFWKYHNIELNEWIKPLIGDHS